MNCIIQREGFFAPLFLFYLCRKHQRAFLQKPEFGEKLLVSAKKIMSDGHKHQWGWGKSMVSAEKNNGDGHKHQWGWGMSINGINDINGDGA
jgi:hypothetical protein